MWRRIVAARFAVWVVFLVAVPIAVLLAGLSKWAIIGSAAGAYLLVLVVEVVVNRRLLSEARPRRGLVRRPVEPEPESRQPPEPEPEPEPVAVAAVDESKPKPEPEPEPVALAVVPDPEPEPEPANEEPVDEVPVVVSLPVAQEPRRWNVWELDRLNRASSGAGVGGGEERAFLLLYMREFADPDGMLPVDFDGLVRESFGHLVAAL